MNMLKKCLSVLMAVLLLFGAAGALAQPAEADDPTGLPEVGDVVCGFEAKEIREFALVGAQAVLFEHQRTGAKLMYIANDDTNRVFDLTFLTRPTDNTGLPHVFEHSTLDGSKKYPSKTLFFNLSYQTYNTYMNAETHSMMTSYPIASLSEAQLLKYADFYTDSCLNPMVMEDESIFREEAWRYRLESMDAPLTIEGTVYSEMLGATTLGREATFNGYRAAFPGSVVGLEQGGDPDYIPDMTWESLKNYHDLYYHPSNCIAYLYGQFEDYTAFLRLLDEAFAPFEKKDLAFTDSGYTPITEPVTVSVGFPMAAGTDTANQSEIEYFFVCRGLRDDQREQMVMNTLTDLLNAETSPLMIALKRALPTGSFSCFIDTTAPDDAIVFTAENVNREDAETFRATVDEVLAQIAEQGFNTDMVDGVTAGLAISTRLIGENSDVGVSLIPTLAYYYATSGNAYNYLDYVAALDNLKAWNEEGLYREGIRKWLVGSRTTALATTYPEPGQKEVKDAALAEKLAAVKAAMTEDELRALVEQSSAKAEEEDTSAMVARLQAVTVASLPEEYKEYDVSDTTGEDTVRRVTAEADVDGIGRVALFLDASGLPQEEIHWLQLYAQLLGDLNTAGHAKEELDVLSSRYLYSRDMRVSLIGNQNAFKPYLRLGWIGTDEDLATGYDLMYELAFETDFADERLAERVSALRAELRSTINAGAYSILLYRSLAVSNPMFRYYNYLNFLDYYAFLETVETQMQAGPEAVTARLRQVQTALRNRYHAIAVYTGSEDGIAENAPLADAFMAKLDSAPFEAAEYDLPVPARREALIVDQQVQYNSLIADYASLGMDEYHAGLDAVMSLVGDVFLMPQLRDQYGVYTPMAGAVTDGGVYLLAYRDPNIRQTFAVYDGLAEQLRGYQVSQETLDGYIMSAYAGYAKSTGELTSAMNAVISLLNGEPQDRQLQYMRQLKSVTPETMERAADMFEKLSANGVRATAGSAAAINANSDLYDVILNPFNAQDMTQVVLDDVKEGQPHYEAMRFAFENGLMGLQGENTFGADAPATVGDLYAAIYVMIGGEYAPEEAYNGVIEYGLAPAEYAFDAIVTRAICDGVFGDFADMIFGVEMPALSEVEADDTPVTRGELAEQIKFLSEAE